MPSIVSPREPVAAAEHEAAAVARLAELLGPLRDGRRAHVPRIRGPEGEEVELPETVLALLRRAVHHLQRGDSVALIPLPPVLTTFEAAGLLNISLAELDELLEHGEISKIEAETESHLGRRIPLDGVLAYRKRERARRQQALDELTRMSQEFGLYDLVEMPAE